MVKESAGFNLSIIQQGLSVVAKEIMYSKLLKDTVLLEITSKASVCPYKTNWVMGESVKINKVTVVIY